MRRLSAIHRVVAVLSGALLVQLTLLSSGTLCRMHAHHSRGDEPASMAHAAHARPMSMPTGGASPAEQSRSSHGRCDTGASGSPCASPWSTGECASMANCVTSLAAAVPTTPIAAMVIASGAPPAMTAAMPPAPSLAPKLPPPRA